MKGFYSDKNKHPWNNIFKDLQKSWGKGKPIQEQQEELILVREAVFGALEILSFGLISEISTLEIIEAFTSETNWNLGRRKARNLCLDVADKLIGSGETRYLLPSALKREGFGFLVSRVEEAEIEQFRKARPKTSRGHLNLSKLEKSILGSRFLRNQMVMETKLDAIDPQVPVIEEAYELQLVELEFERTTSMRTPRDTEQVTLNGQPVMEINDEDKIGVLRKKKTSETQTPLTEFLDESKPSDKKRKTKGNATKAERGRKK